MDTNTEREVVVNPAPQPPVAGVVSTPRIGWSAVISGVIATAGIWLLLHALGVGVGLTAVEPEDPSSLRGVGIGTGIWAMIVPLIALFLGGMITGFLASPMRRLSAVVHGVLVWSIATLLSLVITVSLVSSLVGGAVRAGGQIAGAAGAAASAAAMELSERDPLGSLGLSEQDLLAPVNQRLQQEGKPPVTGDQLADAAREALRTAWREGELNRQIIVDALAHNTDMTRAEAQDIARDIERQWEQRSQALAGRAQEWGEAAGRTALEAAEATGKALLAMFFMMLLGLVATSGGVLVVELRRERIRRNPRATAMRA